MTTKRETARNMFSDDIGLSDGEDWFDEEPDVDFRATPGDSFATFRALEKGLNEKLSSRLCHKAESWNIPMLRSMAIAHFYQSNFKACRDCLMKIQSIQWEQEIEPYDIDVSLMLAECELILDGERIKETADHLINIGLKRSSLTMDDIMAWDAELLRSDRFLGALLLQYLAFRKRTDGDHTLSREKKYFVRSSLSRIAYRLASAKLAEYCPTKQSKLFVEIFTLLLRQLKQFIGPASDDVQVYAVALCHNFLSWCHRSVNLADAAQHAKEGLHILFNEYMGNPCERKLVGDLYLNQAISMTLSFDCSAKNDAPEKLVGRL